MKVKKVIGLINSGGFGNIENVLCDDGKHYARKTFCPLNRSGLTTDIIEKFRQRFVREVETQKRLSHEYVIPIIHDNLKEDAPWFLMPIADYDYIHEIEECKKSNRKPEGLSDILNALEYIHDLGFVHRDLKPGNILFHEGIWKLSDLGLVTQDKDILSLSITSSGGTCYGTENYTAPEQISDFKHVDNRADIYSFGAILHDIFGTGKRTPYSNLSCHGNMGIIVDKCTKREPKHRFKNVDNLRSKLLYLLSKNPTTISLTLQNQLDNLNKLSKFDYAKFEDLNFYLKDEQNDKNSLFYELTNDILNHFFKIDKDLFIEFALKYVEWVKIRSFDFDYCDVIIGLIFNIYKKTDDIDLKAKCVLSAAELGCCHNRWFVMENVIKMSNPEIDEKLALRLQIEIDIEKKNKDNFNKCARRVNKNKHFYHKLIADIL